MTQSGGRNAVRYALGSTIVGVMAAATVVLTSVAPAASVAAEPAVAVVAPVAPAPLAAAAPVTAHPTPTTSRTRASHDAYRPRATSTRGSSSGCGQRAVTAGRFDASCDEYQGYLDPGTSAGRAPSSGEIQTQWGCEQGYIPEDECG
ncbi:hypothetical protein [Actinomycetospora aeridis]|uniref:Uncharacterized protein n=1 Tax=Actinomycetospora aeridis TaxID=3129231 RepID=A0ABU8N1G4_9PSEU